MSSDYDIINASFAEPTSPTSGVMSFIPDPAHSTPAQFKADMNVAKSKGQKVLISIGGANGQVRLESASARDNFVRTMIDIIEEYDFDGLDIDFEGHSLELDAGDEDFRNPTTPLIVNTIDAIESILNHFGPDFMLTMAPETFFVQLGYSYYGGISAGADRRAGAYLPVIHALRDRLTFLQVQNYNSGPITGLDNAYHTMGGADFHVAMIDMMLQGFHITGSFGDTRYYFPPLHPSQVLIGVPANVNAGGGYVANAGLEQAWDCLTARSNCPAYQPVDTYPNLRGFMTWSINWDNFSGNNWSTGMRAVVDN